MLEKLNEYLGESSVDSRVDSRTALEALLCPEASRAQAQGGAEASADPDSDVSGRARTVLGALTKMAQDLDSLEARETALKCYTPDEEWEFNCSEDAKSFISKFLDELGMRLSCPQPAAPAPAAAFFCAGSWSLGPGLTQTQSEEGNQFITDAHL